MIKAIVVDLDGTLLDSKGNIHQSSIEAFALARRTGILPIIATGRNLLETKFAADAIGANKRYILLTGGLVLDEEGGSIYENAIPEDAYRAAVDVLKKYDGAYAEMYTRSDVYINDIGKLDSLGMPEKYVKYIKAHHVYVDDYLKIAQKRVIKLLVVSNNSKMLQGIRDDLAQIDELFVTSSISNALEVLHSGVHKGIGVEIIMRDLKLRKEELAVIGDSENDIGMFNKAGYCVAVGNAFVGLKEKADFITKSNDENGIQLAIETILTK